MKSVSEQKSKLRRSVLARLKKLDAAYIRNCSAVLCMRIEQILHENGVRNVCLYAPMSYELNFLPLLRYAPEFSYYFPRIAGNGELSFHRVVDAATDLRCTKHCFSEPPETAEELAPGEAHFILVPGLAFTTRGDRLGHGGGYYDRFLARCPQASTVAATMFEQIFSTLPTEPHDLRVERVLTAIGDEGAWDYLMNEIGL